MHVCEKIITFSSQPFDDDYEVHAGEIGGRYRVYWNPGDDGLQMEMVCWFCGGEDDRHDFLGPMGRWFQGWAKDHFAKVRSILENDDPAFEAFRSSAFSERESARHEILRSEFI